MPRLVLETDVWQLSAFAAPWMLLLQGISALKPVYCRALTLTGRFGPQRQHLHLADLG